MKGLKGGPIILRGVSLLERRCMKYHSGPGVNGRYIWREPLHLARFWQQQCTEQLGAGASAVTSFQRQFQANDHKHWQIITNIGMENHLNVSECTMRYAERYFNRIKEIWYFWSPKYDLNGSSSYINCVRHLKTSTSTSYYISVSRTRPKILFEYYSYFFSTRM